MPKHQIIRDVGISLVGVLRAGLASANVKATALLANPTPEVLQKSSPCLLLSLYELRPWLNVRKGEPYSHEEEIVDEKGETHVIKYAQPLELDLRFLLCAGAGDPGLEFELLGVGMKAFLDKPRLAGEDLVGDAFMKGEEVAVHEDTDFTLEKSLALLGGFGAGPRVAVGYSTQARLFTGREIGRTKRVRQRHIDVFDPLRPPPGSMSAKALGLDPRAPKPAPAKK
jgi:hypothetical protein